MFFETGSHLYVSYTLKAILQHATLSDISRVALPSSELAASDQINNDFGGLFWIDEKDEDGTNRLYLPNCFDTIRSILASNKFYFMYLENKSNALNELGEEEEANECLTEANTFRRFFELRKSGGQEHSQIYIVELSESKKKFDTNNSSN